MRGLFGSILARLGNFSAVATAGGLRRVAFGETREVDTGPEEVHHIASDVAVLVVAAVVAAERFGAFPEARL